MGKYAIEISNQTLNLVSHDIVGANPTFLTKKVKNYEKINQK